MPEQRPRYVYAWDALRRNVAQAIEEAIGAKIDTQEFTKPPSPGQGDLAFGCFRLAKERGISPAELAKQVVEKMHADDITIASATAVGPYVNITIRASELVDRVIRDVETMKGLFGRTDTGKGEVVMIEYANPNTHKEIHIGHLRNVVIGVSLSRLLATAGYELIPVSYINDVGSNVAKCLWLLVKDRGFDVKTFSEEQLANLLGSVPIEERTARYLGEVYTRATRALEEKPEDATEVSFVLHQLEMHEGTWERLWQETHHWCMDEIVKIFEEMGVKIERQYLESEILDRSQAIVDDLIERGIATPSQGAMVVNLEDEKLGVWLLRKSDGNLLYSAKDLALSELKLHEYPNLQRGLILVDHRQSLYFNQLFATLRRMGVRVPFVHVPYELVTLKDGAMSSRKGNIVTYQGFRDAVIAYAQGEIVKRHTDWPDGKIAYTAWALAMAGMKFGMLKTDSDRMIVFDMDQALSFDGATGPYVQYAATRLASILRKTNWKAETGLAEGDLRVLTHPSERQLALAIASFPETVARSATELRPSYVAAWCLEMASLSNAFYRDVPVMQSDETLRPARLRLVAAAQSVLLLGLHLLGIPAPEEM